MIKEIEIKSPFDNSVIEKVILNNADEVDYMLTKALELYNNKNSWLSINGRISILKNLALSIHEKREEFSKLIATEGGKPLADARIETARAINCINVSIKSLSYVNVGQEISMDDAPDAELRSAFTIYEPIGVVFAISAFNHPLNLIIHQIIPAIATGCPVIIKPSLLTPLNCIKLIELIKEAGLPKYWCQMCLCEDNIAETVVKDKRIAFFSFIGSAKVGWYLKSKLSPGVHCSLEHGGIAPAIIDKNIDINYVVNSILKGGFYHSGQVCVSTQRVFINENIIQSFLKKNKKTN